MLGKMLGKTEQAGFLFYKRNPVCSVLIYK